MKPTPMLVKICGISNWIDAELAIQNGADALGFVMGGCVLPVEVEPHAQTIREIIQRVPKNVDTFLVTHLLQVDDIIALSEYIGCSGIQVSEALPPESIADLRRRTTKKIIKTVVVQDQATSLAYLHAVEPYVDFLLLDTRHGGYTGGTGVINDWKVCQALVSAATKPVYIAGGLTPENLLSAMQTTYPQGVDVSTGVSTYSPLYLRKDRKDEEKIRTFTRLAKSFYET